MYPLPDPFSPMFSTQQVLYMLTVISFGLGTIFGLVVAGVSMAWASLSGLAYGMDKIHELVYNYGGISWIRHSPLGKKPWKGYNSWRSENWNRTHTF